MTDFDTFDLRNISSLISMEHEHSVEQMVRGLEGLTALLDRLPGMVFICRNDKVLSFEYVSRGGKEILGYDPDQIVRVSAFRDLVPREDSIRNKILIDNMTRKNNRYQTVYRVKTKSGKLRWVHEQAVGIFSVSGRLNAIEGVVFDMSRPQYSLVQPSGIRGGTGAKGQLGSLIGKSSAMKKVYDRIVKAAETCASVIITGESGSGKGVAAKAIHEISRRRNNPFIAVNCGAVSGNLLESEFFGNVRGAFSGAYTQRSGFLKAADSGTLFLDEIGEMPLRLQIKLLRALDGEGFIPVGGVHPCFSDFRVVCATNRSPVQMVREGKMREDFFYRINMLTIHMPPLRQRMEDIALLIDHFVEQYRKEIPGIRFPGPELYRRACQYHWPGNVRELHNYVRRYLVFGELHFDAPIQRQVAEPFSSMSISTPIQRAAGREERDVILSALHLNHWHKGRTAAYLGISRRTLQRKVNKFDIRPT